MVTTTDIEKKSLEAHVDLCAQRYLFLEEKLESVENKVCSLAKTTQEIKDAVVSMSEKRNNQLINWGVGIIVFLISIVGYLLHTYVIK